MNAISLFFLAGLQLIGGELLAPCRVLGMICGWAFLGGCVAVFNQPGALGGFIIFAAAVELLGFTPYINIKIKLLWLLCLRFGKSLVVQSESDTQNQSLIVALEAALGRAAKDAYEAGAKWLCGRRRQVLRRILLILAREQGRRHCRWPDSIIFVSS